MYKLENNIEWTEELKNAFKHGITRGKITYINNNENVTIDENTGIKSIKIYDEKNTPEQGFIGQATAKQVDIELIKETNLENEEIEVFLGADYNNQTYYINYGKFIVNQAPENDTTNSTIKITAFDYMIKFNKPYIPNVTFPCTMKAMLEDICTQCDVELATQNFANMNFIVDSNQFDGKECRDVLKHIAKSAFSWARIGQDNKLYLDFNISNTITETITVEEYYQDNYKRANETFGPINRVVYAESNIQGQEEKVEDTDSIALNGLHELVIYDNYFAYTTAYRQELIQAGTRLFGLKYIPIQELKMVGLAYLDCTDVTQIIEPDNTEIITIPLNHIIEYNGAISDSLSSQTSSSNEKTYKNTNNPINSNSLAEIIVDRALKQIRLIVDNFVDLSKTKTGNNYLFIDDIPTGDGYITKFVVKGNTEYFTQTNITIVASEGIKNQETVLITENEDTLLTENGDSILTENKTLYVAKKNITLNSPLRSLTIDGKTYYDELQILQNGTIQIIKRIGISANQTLYLLDQEEVTILEDTFVLPSSENGYYYFIQEINNLDYYAEYIFKNEYSNIFATTLQLQSEIKLLEDMISLSVSELSTNLNAKLELKVNLTDLISEINASADVIRLMGQRLIIDMQNYGLDETGYMMALKGEIAGFNFLSNKFSKAYNMLYNFTSQDVQLLMGYLNDYNSLSGSLQSLYELIGDSSLNVLDVVKMANIINGTVENTKTSSGEVSINSDDSNNLINITNNLGVNKTRIGIISIYAYLLSADIISLAEDVNGNLNGIILDKNKIKITLRDSNNNKTTTILPSGITTPTVTQTSIADSKKNFELLENALDIVNKIDIYKYNFLEEKETDKKHIGFVIGDKFNYAKEVTSKNNDGADTYSLASVCLKAIKEQQKEIEELKLEIAKLKGEN